MSSLARRPGGMWSMLAWLVAGSVIAFFGMSLMTVGLPVLAIAIVAAALRNWKWDLPGLLAGVSLPVLWVAWKNRGGSASRPRVCLAAASFSTRCLGWSLE